MAGRSMVRTPAVCTSKCPWSRYCAPNCSQQLFHQRLSFQCVCVFVTVNVGLCYRPRTLEKTRKRHKYAAHITLNPAVRSWYSSSKLKENLNEAAVAHHLNANNYTSRNRRAGKTLKDNRQFEVLQQEDLHNLCTVEYKPLRSSVYL